MKGSVFHFEKKRQHKFLLNTSLFKVFWKYDLKKFVLGMAFKWDIPIFINWLNIVSNILLFFNLFICLFQIPIEFRKVFSIDKSQISGNNDFNGCFSPLFLLTQLLYFVQRWTDDLCVEQLLSCIYQINLNIWIAINWRKYSYEQPLIEDEFKGFPLQFKKNNRVKTNQFYI